MKRNITTYLTSFVVLFMGILLTSFSPKPTYDYPFQDPSVPLEKRVDNLVSLLTLDEKINQMVNNAPAISRLGIPAYNWWNETLHGVARSRITSHRTHSDCDGGDLGYGCFENDGGFLCR